MNQGVLVLYHFMHITTRTVQYSDILIVFFTCAQQDPETSRLDWIYLYVGSSLCKTLCTVTWPVCMVAGITHTTTHVCRSRLFLL